MQILGKPIGLKPSVADLHAHIHKHQLAPMAKPTRSKKPQPRSKKPQSRAKKPQSRAKVPQSRAKAPQPRVKGAGKIAGQGAATRRWKACVKFLAKDYSEISKKPMDTVQLLCLISCSALVHGISAEVNWYIGGNSIVTLPAATAEAKPGAYLANTTWSQFGAEDYSEMPVASIDHLRWLGTASELMTMTRASRKELGNQKYARLVEMLTFNCDPGSDEAIE